MFWLESPNIPMNQLNQLLLLENREGFNALVSGKGLRSKQIFLPSMSLLQFYHSHTMPMTPSLHQDKAKQKRQSFLQKVLITTLGAMI